MLELETGHPPWYRWFILAVFLILALVLLVEPLQLQHVLLLVASSLVVLWMESRELKEGKQYPTLCLSSDFSICLIDRKGLEIPAERAVRCWVTRQLIVVTVRLADRRRANLLIARARNHPDAFRRFSVICRFGFAVDDSERHNVAQINPKEA